MHRARIRPHDWFDAIAIPRPHTGWAYPRCNAAKLGETWWSADAGGAARGGRGRGMFKDVVVNLSGRGPRDFAADYATSIAAAFGARVAGISFLYEPVIPDGTLGGIPVDLIELQREENSKLANDAVSRFEAGAKKAGGSAETRILDATVGGAAPMFAPIARRFDLALGGPAHREGTASDDLVVEAALFESGRPMVVVPYIQKRGMTLERVLACWDGGRTAARAIGDAMPFLERAKAVDVVIVAEERKSDEVDGANM